MAERPGETVPADRRFVVLRHADRDDVHFDLMIEAGESLETWKSPTPPEETPVEGAVWRRIGAHRRIYLDYEGPVRPDRGQVRRHDAGTCRVAVERSGCWKIDFSGGKLCGPFSLEEIGGGQDWRLRRL